MMVEVHRNFPALPLLGQIKLGGQCRRRFSDCTRSCVRSDTRCSNSLFNRPRSSLPQFELMHIRAGADPLAHPTIGIQQGRGPGDEITILLRGRMPNPSMRLIEGTRCTGSFPYRSNRFTIVGMQRVSPAEPAQFLP